MGKPALSGNPNSFFLSAAQVLVGGVDIGFASKVGVKIKHEVTEAKTDQFGKTVANHFYVGDSCSVDMMLDELTAAKLKSAYPFASLITGMGGAARITWGNAIGGNFYSIAQQLQLKPTVDDEAFLDRNFLFYKAAPVGDSEIKYSPDGKTEIKVTFHCYPDPTKPVGEYFGYFGDINAGLIVHATKSSPTAGGGNVGNGTLGTITVSDSYTLTETWAAVCIKAVTDGGLFAVSGSVSGAKGVAQVGSTFHSNIINTANSEVNFILNDGATDFAVGDSFTFTTTAKQYV